MLRRTCAIILYNLSTESLTMRQIYDLGMITGQYKSNSKQPGSVWYRSHGANVRDDCKLLLRFKFIRKVKRIKRYIQGQGPWLFAITDRGKEWLEKNDINTLYKKRVKTLNRSN
jgi:hypothetical protein